MKIAKLKSKLAECEIDWRTEMLREFLKSKEERGVTDVKWSEFESYFLKKSSYEEFDLDRFSESTSAAAKLLVEFRGVQSSTDEFKNEKKPDGSYFSICQEKFSKSRNVNQEALKKFIELKVPDYLCEEFNEHVEYDMTPKSEDITFQSLLCMNHESTALRCADQKNLIKEKDYPNLIYNLIQCGNLSGLAYLVAEKKLDMRQKFTRETLVRSLYTAHSMIQSKKEEFDPLKLALNSGHLKIILFLVNARSLKEDQTTLTAAFPRAVYDGNTSLVLYLAAQYKLRFELSGSELSDSKSENNEISLEYLAKMCKNSEDYSQRIQLLLDANVCSVNQLFHAFINLSPKDFSYECEMLDFMMQHYEVNAYSPCSLEGVPAYEAAVLQNKIKVVEFFLKNADEKLHGLIMARVKECWGEADINKLPHVETEDKVVKMIKP